MPVDLNAPSQEVCAWVTIGVAASGAPQRTRLAMRVEVERTAGELAASRSPVRGMTLGGRTTVLAVASVVVCLALVAPAGAQCTHPLFQSSIDYGAGSRPVSVAVGDFDGDTDLDLAVANAASTNVPILLGNADGRRSAMPRARALSPLLTRVGLPTRRTREGFDGTDRSEA